MHNYRETQLTEGPSKPIRPLVRLRRQDIPDGELLADLRRVAQSLGTNTVSYADCVDRGRFSKSTLFNRFGSWTAALSAAGLERGVEKIDDDECLFANLLEVWTRLGRQPTRKEMRRPLSKWSERPYLNRFGSWNNALIAFGRFVDPDVEGEQEVPAPLPRRDGSGHRTPRFPNLRMRWRVLKRDFFRCMCGRSPATDPSVVLHVDHVTAWANGGETVLENLRTLCDKCNLGKGAT